MQVRVIKRHAGEGVFPVFIKGTQVILGEETNHYPHWYACEIEGYQTYIADSFVDDGRLTKDYNPTELVQDVGDILDVQEIVYDWLLARNDKGITGWIPAEAVVEVDERRG